MRMLQRPTEDDASSVLLFNQTDLDAQIDVADFNNVETSEESEQSEVFTNIGSSADAHHEIPGGQK